jgi:poly(3-hydroxybutyrate) depolymerase
LGLVAAGVLFVTLGMTWAADTKSEGQGKAGQQAAVLDKSVEVTMKYLLYLPKDYDHKASWPLLLFLHGAGERGDDLDLVKKHGPPKLIEAGKDFPFIVVSPQCPQGRWWEPVELATLLDEIVEKHKVDKDRIYVTGLSMGGFGTWSLAAYQPKRFSAIVPICGGGEPFVTMLLANVPAWVFHGAKDPVVPLERSEKMVEAMKKFGGKVKFTVYPEAGHDAWTEAYNDPQLYEWLLQQKRTPKKADAAVKPTTSPAEWASTFNVDKTNLVSRGKNPYFILEPGHRLHFKGDIGHHVPVTSFVSGEADSPQPIPQSIHLGVFDQP